MHSWMWASSRWWRPLPIRWCRARVFARLRAAGVRVEVGPGADESRELNLGFFSRMVRKTPWVRMKVAASLDGATALHQPANGLPGRPRVPTGMRGVPEHAPC